MKQRGNGRSSLKRRRRRGDGMTEFDLLPAELRQWLSAAVLPWRPRSVKTAYLKALKRVGDADQAMAELSRVERRLVAKDAYAVWGEDHPFANN